MNYFKSKLAVGLASILFPLLTSCTSPGPKIDSVATDPNPAVAPRIHFTLTGSGFDADSVRAFFKGPGCYDPCEVPANAIDARTAAKISGLADLGVGTYEIMIRNGDGPISNSVSVTLVAAPPKK